MVAVAVGATMGAAGCRRENLMSFDKLHEVFGPPRPVGTARVLTSPSRLSKETAEKLCQELSLDVVMRDLGAVAARVIADSLEELGLRAADYADLESIPKTLAKRIADEVQKNPESFNKALVDQLALRG